MGHFSVSHAIFSSYHQIRTNFRDFFLEKLTNIRSYLFGSFVLVRNYSLHSQFEVRVEGKPDFCPCGIPLHQSLIVGKCVIVEEEPAADVEGYEDIDGVVFVGCEYEKDTEHVHHPGERVEIINVPRGI